MVSGLFSIFDNFFSKIRQEVQKHPKLIGAALTAITLCGLYKYHQNSARIKAAQKSLRIERRESEKEPQSSSSKPYYESPVDDYVKRRGPADTGLVDPSEAYENPDREFLWLGLKDGPKPTKLSDRIGDLSKLIILVLSSNLIQTLPSTIVNLQQLEHIDLSDNRFKEFPLEVCSLKQLKYLDLGGNEISEVPSKIGNLNNLEKFSLASNSLVHLPNEIGGLKKLKILNLRINKIQKIPKEIVGALNLEHLDLSVNPIEEMSDCLFEFPQNTTVYIKQTKLTEKKIESFISKNIKRKIIYK